MAEFPRIAVINTGWSDDYRGDQVRGNFGYLDGGEGHERYNFLKSPDGRFYGYAPPLGETWSPPKPAEKEDWLVFFVSKKPGRSGLYLVGWYESARFTGDYSPRPDADRFGLDPNGDPFFYTVSSSKGYLVPLALRRYQVKGDRLKRSYAYLRGNGGDEPWRESMAEALLGYRELLAPILMGATVDDDVPRLAFIADPARRGAIEEAAIEAAKSHFADYFCETREQEKIGYDLMFTHKQTGELLHVEVKGTSLPTPGFFLTRNERGYAESLALNDHRARRNKDGSWRPLWRLVVVSGALNEPVVHEYTFAKMNTHFEIAPYAWRGTLKETA
jgi:hypothetical protein